MIVPRSNARQAKRITHQLKWLSEEERTTRIVPMMSREDRVPLHCRRFVFGYALDNSEFPCYLLLKATENKGIELLPPGLVFGRVLGAYT